MCATVYTGLHNSKTCHTNGRQFVFPCLRSPIPRLPRPSGTDEDRPLDKRKAGQEVVPVRSSTRKRRKYSILRKIVTISTKVEMASYDMADKRDESDDYADDLERLLAACENICSPAIELASPIFDNTDSQEDRPTTSATANETIEYVTLDTPLCSRQTLQSGIHPFPLLTTNQ